MIHRKFLELSFTNSAFAFTRRTCIAASKTILKEAFSTADQDGPVLWIEQAFTIAAGIILSLDALHRSAGERDYHEHVRLVADAATYLKRFKHSRIAERGAQVLQDLQENLREGGRNELGKRSRIADPREDGFSPKRARQHINRRSMVDTPLSGSVEPSDPTAVDQSDPVQDFWNSMHNMYQQDGHREQSLFDDFLSFRF
ncbi:hypothetical protein NX059_000011 [Plenodomus lindquistii]|nr:hypothetical protein NX059_000011 [Plenodomus lindquistii]